MKKDEYMKVISANLGGKRRRRRKKRRKVEEEQKSEAVDVISHLYLTIYQIDSTREKVKVKQQQPKWSLTASIAEDIHITLGATTDQTFKWTAQDGLV